MSRLALGTHVDPQFAGETLEQQHLAEAVLALRAKGKTVRQIRSELGVSMGSVLDVLATPDAVAARKDAVEALREGLMAQGEPAVAVLADILRTRPEAEEVAGAKLQLEAAGEVLDRLGVSAKAAQPGTQVTNSITITVQQEAEALDEYERRKMAKLGVALDAKGE